MKAAEKPSTSEANKANETSRTSEVLVVDVGNTETRVGLARDGELAITWSATTPEHITADEARMTLEGFFGLHACEGEGGVRIRPTDAIVASVVPDLTDKWIEALRRACGRRPLVVGPGLKTGLKMRYNDPAEIGADRMADLVAAKAQYGSPVVVVDWGTTTNFEVIDCEGAFVGGLIAPGLRLSVASLSQAAARLSMIEVKVPPSVIGKNTREAMQSGAVMGEVARVDGLIDLVWSELGYETVVVVSGNDAASLSSLMRHKTHIDNDLTLRGLCLLHRMNRKNV